MLPVVQIYKECVVAFYNTRVHFKLSLVGGTPTRAARRGWCVHRPRSGSAMQQFEMHPNIL